MKKVLILFILLCSTALCSQTVDLIAVPQEYQGVWHLIGTSADKGTTVVEGDGSPFCKVSSSSIMYYDGKKSSISTVKQITQGDIVYTGLSFGTDRIWVISKSGTYSIMVQTLDAETGAEIIRALFVVK